jgi:hypothetical protein
MDKYYTLQDERKYLALVNLECLHFEGGEYQQARRIVEKIRA